MSIFKQSFDDNIKAQINARQNAMAQRDANAIKYLNTRAAWIKMTSAVNVNNSPALADKYVLLGGTLSLSGDPRAGVGTSDSNAYSTKTGETTHRGGAVRPMPGITSIDVKTKSAYGSLMEATVNFVCWDIKQLEELELLYMRPNYSVLLEWGWAPYLTNKGGVDTTVSFNATVIAGTATKEAIWKEIWNNSKETGNYCGLYGFVKNYSWSARPDGGYDCSTTIITMGEIIESLKVNFVNSKSNVAETGIFGIADAENFKKDGPLNKAYQRSYLAGIIYELYVSLAGVAKSKEVVSNTLGYNFYCYEFKSEGDTATTSDGGEEKAKPDTFVSEPINIYIKLKDFVSILNKYVLLSDGKSPITELSLTEGFHQSKPNTDLLCLGHPYQISMDPTVCLINNETFSTNITATAAAAATEGGISEAGNTANEVIFGLKGKDEFPEKIDEAYYGKIGNIYVNLAYLYTLITDDGLASQDKKEKKDINLFDFVKNMMSGINSSIGNVSNFDVHVDPTDSVARIIDVNYVDTETKAEAYKNALTINLYGLTSIVRSYKLESQIFPEQSAVVAIGAQAKGGALGTGDNTLIDFNQSLTDRIVKAKDLPPATPNPADSAALDNLKVNLETIAEYFTGLDDGNQFTRLFGGGATFDKSKASQYTNSLKDIISYTRTLTEDKNNNTAIIPTKLSIEMDGIGGIIIGSIFKIPDTSLPRGYTGAGGVGARIGYLVTSIAHSIDSSNDWKTTIGAQFIILDGEPTRSLTKITSAITKATARKVERVTKITKKTEETPQTPKVITESKETEKKKSAKKPKPSPCPGGKTNKFDIKANPGILPTLTPWEQIKKGYPIIPANVGVPVQAVGAGVYGESGKDYLFLINYFGIRPRTNKTVKYIVIHYTAGAGRITDPLSPYKGTWAKPRGTGASAFHACADFVVAWNGRIAGVKSYKKYYSNHYGNATWPGVGNMNAQSIGIEVESVGYCYYCGSNKKFYKNNDSLIDAKDIAYLDPDYRGYNLWERHPDVQISALANLLIALYNDGILADKAQFLVNVPNMGIAFPPAPLRTDPGCSIITHGTGSSKGKVDTFPQSNLVEMLKQLPALIKANPNLKFKWQGQG
jgi:hypothetical protein